MLSASQPSSAASGELDHAAMLRNSDNSMAAFAKSLLHWSNSDLIQRFYALFPGRYTHIVQSPAGAPLTIVPAPTTASVAYDSQSALLASLSATGVNIYNSPAVDSRGNLGNLSDYVPLTYSSTSYLPQQPESGADTRDVVMTDAPGIEEARMEILAEQLSLGRLAASFGPRPLRDYLRRFNLGVQCLILQNIVGYAQTFTIILAFLLGDGWCSPDMPDGLMYTLIAFHAAFTIHHARIEQRMFGPWDHLNRFAELGMSSHIHFIITTNSYIPASLPTFQSLHFMTETSMITLRSLAQQAARLRLETLVLARWHVFASDRIELTAGDAMFGARKLIEEIVEFLKNPSGALVSHLTLFC